MVENTNKNKAAPVLCFIYSTPYEEVFLKLLKIQPTSKHHQEGKEKAKIAQKLWGKYENKVLNLFEDIYKIKITENPRLTYVSLVAPNSFSRPLTISLARCSDLNKNRRSEKAFVYSVIHELAHYFSYTRKEATFFNKLLTKIQKMNVLKDPGANLHFLIQAVEFAIIAEVFGAESAEYRREWIIKNFGSNEYSKSATLLKKHNIPLDKTCLIYIQKFLDKFTKAM